MDNACRWRARAGRFESGSTSMIYLDGLHLTEREVQEIHNLMRQYEVLPKVPRERVGY